MCCGSRRVAFVPTTGSAETGSCHLSPRTLAAARSRDSAAAPSAGPARFAARPRGPGGDQAGPPARVRDMPPRPGPPDPDRPAYLRPNGTGLRASPIGDGPRPGQRRPPGPSAPVPGHAARLPPRAPARLRGRDAPGDHNLPSRPAPVLARTLTSLSALSGGRVILGIGAGATSSPPPSWITTRPASSTATPTTPPPMWPWPAGPPR